MMIKMIFRKATALTLVLVMILAMIASCANTDKDPVDSTTGPNSDNPADEATTAIYVDASAAEGGNGSEASPFATIAEAQAKIREIKANGSLPEGGITVYLADGDYDPIVFDENDSGEEGAPITYLAKNKLGANITGGIRLSKDDFKPADDAIKARLYDSAAADKLLQIDLKEYGLTAEDWGAAVNDRSNLNDVTEGELFINNERMPLGQYPNEKWITAPATTDGSEDAKAELALDADSLAHVAKWQKADDIWVHGYLSVSYFDAASKVSITDNGIILNDLNGKAVVDHSNGHGAVWFWFYNVLEEIDSPGEHYIDRENGILYLYEPEDFDTASIVLSVKNKELVYGTNVNYVSFKDVAFTATRGEAIRLYTSNNITFDGCLVAGIGSTGISADGTKITIQNSEVHDIASYAVGVSGGDSQKLIQNENLVYNNKIHDFGQLTRTYRPGIALNGCGGTASHNEVYNASHTALMYAGQLATFEYNEVYNVCMETLDCGAFYAGRSLSWYGTKINHNYFHDIGTMDIPGAKENYFRAAGIYLDDGLSGVEVVGNLVENTTGRGIYIGGGRDCVVSNNLIINGQIFAMEYDSRMWDAVFTDYGWFSFANLDAMLADIAKILDSENGDIWKERFPSMADAVLEYVDQDPSNPKLMISPVNNVVTNNVYIGQKRIYVDAIENEKFASYNTISGNWVIKTNNLVDYESGNFDVKEDANMWKHVPDFKQIQWRSMGLVD